MRAERQFRCEAVEEGAEVDWPQFLEGLAGLAACHCCGGGLSGAAAIIARAPMRLRDPRRWQAHPAGAAHAKLPTCGAFVLPDITLAAPGAPARTKLDLTVQGGRIAAIAPSGSVPATVQTIEACRGAVVSPALVDMHAHMPPWNALRLTRLFLLLTLRYGVTIVRDAGDADGTATPAALALVRGGLLPGPDIRYAYAFVGRGRRRWANTITLESPEQADGVAQSLAVLGASWIKSYENLTLADIRALKTAALKYGLGVMGHTPTASRIEDAGLPDPQHFFGAPLPEALQRDHVFERHVAWEGVDAARMDVIVAASVQQGVAHTPTLAMNRALLAMDPTVSDRAREVGNLLPRFYSEIVWNGTHGLPAYRGLTALDFERVKRALDKKLELTRRLHEADVPLRLGTDTQQPYVVPGFALHEEMAAFRDAGVSADAVWRLATEGAAKALGVGDHGALKVGDRAELIVSRDAHTGAPSPDRFLAVVAGGRLAFVADLDREIDRERRSFEGAFAPHITRWLAKMALRRAASSFVS